MKPADIIVKQRRKAVFRTRRQTEQFREFVFSFTIRALIEIAGKEIEQAFHFVISGPKAGPHVSLYRLHRGGAFIGHRTLGFTVRPLFGGKFLPCHSLAGDALVAVVDALSAGRVVCDTLCD